MFISAAPLGFSMPTTITIRKRDGLQEEFSLQKLAASIQKALAQAQAKKPETTALSITEKVHVQLLRIFNNLTPRSQDIHDVVVESLEKAGQQKAAKVYDEQRKSRYDSQKFHTILGVRDELGFSVQAVSVLAHQYLIKNEEGTVIETPGQMFRRVAKAIAQAERNYGGNTKKSEDEFYELLASRNFLPSSTVLMNAGVNNHLLPNAMLPVPDDLEGIFAALGKMALLQKSGTSVSISLDDLRPRGSLIKGNKGYSGGPVSFLRLFDTAADVVMEGTRRRASNMVTLRLDHPDIEEFINVTDLRNFKKGVVLTDIFINAAIAGKEWRLVDANGKEVKRLAAAALFDTVIAAVHATAEPAIIFSDQMGEERQFSTTACPCQPLGAYEGCQQGVINLAAMVDRNHIAWERLRMAVAGAVRFMDDAIDATVYAIPEIEQATKSRRRLGLGVMGFADMLALLGIPYGSKRSFETADKVMKFISDEARKASVSLAKARGPFPAAGQTKKPVRNDRLLTIMPSGRMSLLGPATQGIEPICAVVCVRELGGNVLDVQPVFERMMREKGAYSPANMVRICKSGLGTGVPRGIRALFLTEIPVETHLKVQAAFQRYVDNGVGKAVVITSEMKVADVRKILLLAHKLGLKDVWFKKDEEPCCGI
jgi:ribonucleoside-diphosphate reductase alpha chain